MDIIVKLGYKIAILLALINLMWRGIDMGIMIVTYVGFWSMIAMLASNL